MRAPGAPASRLRYGVSRPVASRRPARLDARAHGAAAPGLSASALCAAARDSDGAPVTHHIGEHHCVLCSDRDAEPAALAPAAAPVALRPDGVASIGARALSPRAPPLGWASSWSSRAPPSRPEIRTPRPPDLGPSGGSRLFGSRVCARQAGRFLCLDGFRHAAIGLRTPNRGGFASCSSPIERDLSAFRAQGRRRGRAGPAAGDLPAHAPARPARRHRRPAGLSEADRRQSRARLRPPPPDRGEPSPDSATMSIEPPAAETSPEERLDDERRSAAAKAVDTLPPRCREAFELHIYHDVPLTEVARRMEISDRMARKHASRARACRALLRRAVE